MLKISNLSFSYDSKPILKDINLILEPKEKFVIEGDNGSGKTTLFKIILGFLKPDKGSILLNTDKIGYVSQMNMKKQDRFPVSVFELLALRMPDTNVINLRSKKKIVHHTLSRVGMQDFIHRPVSTLSGGQFQRVMIARELIVEPDLILLDEPTNALDIESKISLLSLLEELEIGVGLITHDSLDHNFRRFKLEDGFLSEVE